MIEYHLVRFFNNGNARLYPSSCQERADILAGEHIERWFSHWYGALLMSTRGRVFSVELVGGNPSRSFRDSSISRRNLESLMKVIDSIEMGRSEDAKGRGRRKAP
jgi:hypothetical protein